MFQAATIWVLGVGRTKWSGQQPDHRCDFPVCLTLHSRGGAAAKPHTRICSYTNACTYSESSMGALQPQKAQRYAVLSPLRVLVGNSACSARDATRLPERLEGSGTASRGKALDLYCCSLLTISSSHHSFLTFCRKFVKTYVLTCFSRYLFIYQIFRDNSLRNHGTTDDPCDLRLTRQFGEIPGRNLWRGKG